MRSCYFYLFIFFLISIGKSEPQRRTWASQLRSVLRRLQPRRSIYGAKTSVGSPMMISESHLRHSAQYSMPSPMTRKSHRGSVCNGAPAGSYGDPDVYCKAFHVCQADGRFDVMDCPGSLRFNNYMGVCDWPDKVDPFCNPIHYETKERNEYEFGYRRHQDYYHPRERNHYREQHQYAAAENVASITEIPPVTTTDSVKKR